MCRSVVVVTLFALAVNFVAADDSAAPAEQEASQHDSSEDAVAQDDTKQLLEALTITMISEVIDERTISIRETSKKGSTWLQLGNVRSPADPRKVEAGKEALTKLIGKQMVWWKAAADEHQTLPAAEDGSPVVLADVWLMSGHHVNSMLVKEGHLVSDQVYTDDLARDILTAQADQEKKESYKKLEEALKESEKAKQEAAKEEKERKKKEKELESEPIGAAGWLGISMLGLLVLASFCNFGRKESKKVHLNSKRGAMVRFWSKLKGA